MDETTNFFDILPLPVLYHIVSSAKLLAAANATKHASAQAESLEKEATATLLAQENKQQKLAAVAEAKVLANTAVLLAAANETKLAAAVNEAKMLHTTAKLLAAEYEIKRVQVEAQRRLRSVSTENKRVKDEQQLLRSIMGNVAHDLKTPLMGIEAEAENLREILTTACEKIVSSLTSTEPISPAAALSVISLPVNKLSKDANDLLDNVSSMIQFLSMSIRRSQGRIRVDQHTKHLNIHHQHILIVLLFAHKNPKILFEQAVISRYCQSSNRFHWRMLSQWCTNASIVKILDVLSFVIPW